MTPDPEIDMSSTRLREMLSEQFPHLAQESLVPVDEGWDNFIYRIGAGHAARIPRREVAVGLIRNEQTWLPRLAPRLDVAIPVPVGLGVPSGTFPWPWSIVPWLAGEPADRRPLDPDQAPRLVAVLRSLHRPAPDDAPRNPVRGVPLHVRAATVEARLDRLGLEALRESWRRALDAPVSAERVWLHGDLHPRNVLVANGALVALIDWGDLTAGDPATDLACAWMLFDPDTRERFLDAYGATSEQRSRARGWAVLFASALAGGDPRHAAVGRALVRRLIDAG